MCTRKDGQECVRVEIEYSGDTPHFAGPAWIRRGSENIKASDQQFQRLIELRSSPVRELCQWIDKRVTIEGDIANVELRERALFGHPRWHGQHEAEIVQVTQYYVRFRTIGGGYGTGTEKAEPIAKLILSWDPSPSRLKLLVRV